ncbi:MAG: hypothetical protein ACKPJP_12040 [Microcystis panniformis]
MLLNSQHKIGIFLSCLATTTALNMPIASANPLDFRLHNHTRYTIVRIQVSDSRNTNWGPNLIPGDNLRPGEDTNINFNGPVNWCLFDIKAVFSDGDYGEKYEVNLCQITDFYFNP